jgi:hypothetical protein
VATTTKTRRERWFWEELLEPEDGHLTPLGAAVGAVFALFGFVVGRYIDSTLEDREALIARHRWETLRHQQTKQLTQDQNRADEGGDTDDRDEADTPKADDAEPDAADTAPAGDVVDGEVVAANGTDPSGEARSVAPVSTTEVEKHADSRPYPWLGAPAAEPQSARSVVRAGLTPQAGHSAGYDGAYAGRRYADELPAAAVARGDAVVEVEHPDAATAVAAAATAVAQANSLDPEQPVVVVVAEDVPDWVDEDPGY